MHTESTKKRILSIDILRGLVMVIMALDHTRDFFHLGGIAGDPMNPETTYPALFFTRWITHFCAPTFVFLSGLSAYLSSTNKDPKTASLFLIKRGFWLLFVEIVVVTLGLTFNPLYNFLILQVIWAIGWSMIILGLLMRISKKAILIVGLILFFGHNLLNYIELPAQNTLSGGVLAVLFTTSGSIIPISETRFIGLFYAVLPWTGAMLIGFAAGRLFNTDIQARRRQQILFFSGLGLFLSFLVLRYVNGYGNPTPRIVFNNTLQSVYSFFNVSKYPPSLQYFGMTLGPALMLLSGLERIKNRLTDVLTVYGKVPFFYYVLHFYLLHALVVVVFFVSGYGVKDIVSPNSPFLFVPTGFGYPLAIVYLIWLAVVALLYRPCVWFQKYKATHRQWWLSYL